MQPLETAADNPQQTTESAPPPSRLRIALFSILALAAGTAATIGFEHLRYERFPGFLQARMRNVAAARDAQVAEILVTPGSLVTAGQPLVRLQDAAFDQRLEAKKREIESLDIELAQSQARLEVELEWRRKNILERIFEARLKSVQALRHVIEGPLAVDFGRENGWSAPSALSTAGLPATAVTDRPKASSSQGNGASTLTAGPLSEAELCLQHIEELERMSRDLPAKISRSMGVDLARARLAHAQAELTRLESQKGELTLVAEASGLVGVFQKAVGDRVLAHEPIVQLLDEEQPFLVVQIPSPRISDFSPGTVVELQFPGGRTGKGRVEEIPPQTSPVSLDSGRIGETVITAHVDPVGVLWPNLPFGSVVEVRRLR
jgi:multidrug resistance efflux pump